MCVLGNERALSVSKMERGRSCLSINLKQLNGYEAIIVLINPISTGGGGRGGWRLNILDITFASSTSWMPCKPLVDLLSVIIGLL